MLYIVQWIFCYNTLKVSRVKNTIVRKNTIAISSVLNLFATIKITRLQQFWVKVLDLFLVQGVVYSILELFRKSMKRQQILIIHTCIRYRGFITVGRIMDICRLTVLAKLHLDIIYIIIIICTSASCILGYVLLHAILSKYYRSIRYDIFTLPAIGFDRLIFVQ